MLTFFLLAASSVALRPAGSIEVTGPTLRVGDVASLDGVEAGARARLAEQVVARFPDGRSSVTLPRTALAALIRRSLPGIEVEGVEGGDMIVRRAPAAPDTEAGRICFALVDPVAAGALLSASDAAQAPCPLSSPPAAVAFDRRSGSVRAVADLAAGANLGRISLPASRGVAAGDPLTLTSTVGPVRIQRSVVALQPGRAGGRLFVRTEDGEILAAPLPETAE